MKVSYLTPVYSNEKNRKAHLTHSNEQLPDVKIFSSLPVGCFSPVVLGVRTIKSDKFKQTTFKGNEEDEKLSNLSGLKAIARQAARESMEEIKPEVTEELKREVREELKSVLTQELGTFKTEIKQEIENRNNRLTDSVNNLNKSVGNLERKYNALSETVDQNDKNLTH
jgi:hypothetical protein